MERFTQTSQAISVMNLLISLSFLVIIGLVTIPIDAQENTPYETPDPHPVIIGDPSKDYNYTSPKNVAKNAVTEPYYFPYTITDFSVQFTRAQQEKVVADAFAVWQPYINVNFVYVPDVDPKTVFGHIMMIDTTCGGLGCGGGEGPNTHCFASNGPGGRFIDEKDPNRVEFDLKAIMRHEIGHCLFLPHVSITSQQCIMNPNINTVTTPCPLEISLLQDIWKDAVCTIATCTEGVDVIVDGEMTSLTSNIPNIVQGDIVRLDYTYTNIGNVDYRGHIFFFDATDSKTFVSGFVPTLGAGQSQTSSYLWDTSTASIGSHELRINLSNSFDTETLTANNEIRKNFVINDPSSPSVNYFESLAESLSFIGNSLVEPVFAEDLTFQTCVLPNTCSGNIRGGNFIEEVFDGTKRRINYGVPEFIPDEFGGFVNTIITEDKNSIFFDSSTPLRIDKASCDVFQMEKKRFTDLPAQVIKYDFRVQVAPIGTAVDSILWTDITQELLSCDLKHWTNSTGSYVSISKADAIANFTTIIEKKQSDQYPESFHIFEPSQKLVGFQHGFITEITNLVDSSIKIDNKKIFVDTKGTITEKDDKGNIVSGNTIRKSKADVGINTLFLNGTGSDTARFDFIKGEGLFSLIDFEKDGTNLKTVIKYFESKKELDANEKLILDPSFGYSSGTHKILTVDPTATNPCTNSGATTSDGVVLVQRTDGNGCQRSDFEYDTSGIPSNAVVNAMELEFDMASILNARVCDVYSIENQPSTRTATQRFDDAGDGTVYLDDISTCLSASGSSTIEHTLPAQALTDFATHPTWMGFGVRMSSENTVGSDNFAFIDDVRLRINYTIPINVVARFMESDLTTIITNGEITQSNSTDSVTTAVNSTGQSKFTRLNTETNQNFTAKDLENNFIVNKTINKQFTGYELFDIKGQNYTGSCPSNGSGSDWKILINETDGHHITEFNSPSCSSGDDITWDVTFTANGQSSNSFTSSLITEILSTTAFGVNADTFSVNGSVVSTSYTEPKITSIPFTVGTGKQDINLQFLLSLGSPAPVGGGDGGGGGGGGGGSTTILGSIFEYNFLSTTHRVGFGLDIPGEITVSWDSGLDLPISDIIVDKTNIDSLDVIFNDENYPYSLEWDPDQQITTRTITYILKTPPNICNISPGLDTVISNCAFEKKYEIPVDIKIIEAGKIINKPTTITVDLSSGIGNPTLALFGLLGILGLGIVGIARARSKSRN